MEAQVSAARDKLRALKRELAECFTEAAHHREELRILEETDRSNMVGQPKRGVGRDIASVIKIINALELRNEQCSSWRKQTSEPLQDAVNSFQTIMRNFTAGLQNLEEARADRELHFLTLQRLKEECARIFPTEPTGPTSKDIVKAIQTAVQNENGEDSPLSLELFADALRTDERVSKLLRAHSEAQKQGAIEAVEALNKALGASEEERSISHSVIFDLFFSPEAETEKLLTIMQKTQTSQPSWTLDHKAQNRALKTLESSLKAKLTEYRTREAAVSEELSQVRAQLAERDAREQKEMELVAACAAAQRERNAVKEQQKVMLDRNKALRQSVRKGAVLPLQPAMLTRVC